MQNPSSTCPRCQSPIPADAPGGICPSCALLGVAEPTDPAQAAAGGVPTLEELAAAFPEYEVLEIIGHGGMGVVFKVRQPRLDRLVALKILPPALAAQPGFAERFTREARALARLAHPHIVAVYDFGERAGFYYLLMEFVNGVNLRQAMRAGVTPEQALGLVPRICEALQFAHDRGVLHRDIKPENILLDTAGTPKLADFGIAKMAGDTAAVTGLTATGAALGTAAYMAPEQIEKPSTVDHRADIYSLGVVLYEMLTGELPLGRFAAPSEKSQVGRGVDDVVLRALEKERDRRQQSAREMRTEVEHATQGGRPLMAPQPGTTRTNGIGPKRAPAHPGEKDLGFAYLFWFLLGVCGGHKFYLGKTGWGFLYLFTGGLFFFGWFVDLFTLPLQVRCANEEIRNRPPVLPGAAPDPWPQRIFVLLLALIALPLAIIGVGLVVPMIFSRTSHRPPTQHVAEPAMKPVAIVTAERAPFVGQFSQGSIELVSVAPHPSGDRLGWHMNGIPATEGPFVNRGSKRGAGRSEQAYEFVFRTRNLPSDASTLSWQLPRSTGWSSGDFCALAAQPENPLGDHPVIAATFRENLHSADVRVGVALGSWETLMESGPGNSIERTIAHGGEDWHITQASTVESKNGATIVTYASPSRKNWQTRVAAVLADGREIAPSFSSMLNEQSEWRFDHLPLESVQQFRFQARPYQWVEFRDVALTPAP